MKNPLRIYAVFLLSLAATSTVHAGIDRIHVVSDTSAARKFVANAQNGLLRSIPALSKRTKGKNLRKAQDAASVKPKRPFIFEFDGYLSSSGTYYGVAPKKVSSYTSSDPKKKRTSVKDAMSQALDELHAMRLEMEALRREMQDMKRQVVGGEPVEAESQEEVGVGALIHRRQRAREFDKIGSEIERWAEDLFQQDGEVDGWKEVKCNKVVLSTFNKEGRTKAFLKWMKDPRGDNAGIEDDREYPCIKVYSTIDAPLEDVCVYLSQEQRAADYNDLVVCHRDLEELSPHAKICWGQTPQILFVKPRELITFCYHKWLRDGTQVILNQACDHESAKSGKLPRAYALRGANYISRDPDDPEKTRISLLAHASPGEDVPKWACKTAVNALAPIEPFKLFHKINEGVKRHRPELEQCLDDTEMVSMPGRSPKPAGIAQMGYACFWPKGGGLKEGILHPAHPDFNRDPSEQSTSDSLDESVPAND